MTDHSVSAVIASAGSGVRFGADKVFAEIKGIPVIIHTLKIFQSSELINEIVPVVRRENIDRLWSLIDTYQLTKVKVIAEGGKQRQDSVYKGLCSFRSMPEIVAIHDGARPLLKRELLDSAIRALVEDKGQTQGVVVGVPVKETVKLLMDSQLLKIKETLSRQQLWIAQTPQIFYTNRLIEAFNKALSDGYYATDDSALMERSGGVIKMFMGDYKNIKITTPEDIQFVEMILASEAKTHSKEG